MNKILAEVDEKKVKEDIVAVQTPVKEVDVQLKSKRGEKEKAVKRREFKAV